MDELDWLERGHGSGEGLLPMIKGSTSATPTDRVSIRSVLRGPESGRPRRRTRRRTKALVGWLLYCSTAVGGTAAAFTVRDTLFPSLGAETSRSLWPGPVHDRTASSDTTAVPAAKPVTLFEDSTAPDGSTATSIEDEPASSASLPDDSTTVDSVDDKGSHNSGPSTGTTVVGTLPSTTATTVDDHGGGDPQASASSSPSSVDASAASSVPGSTDDGHQKGKGGGGSGGGSSNP